MISLQVLYSALFSNSLIKSVQWFSLFHRWGPQRPRELMEPSCRHPLLWEVRTPRQVYLTPEGTLTILHKEQTLASQHRALTSNNPGATEKWPVRQYPWGMPKRSQVWCKAPPGSSRTNHEPSFESIGGRTFWESGVSEHEMNYFMWQWVSHLWVLKGQEDSFLLWRLGKEFCL